MAGEVVSKRDHERIRDAIRTRETRTSGEIFAVVARASDGYAYVAGFFAGFWAIALGLFMLGGLWLLDFEVSALTVLLAQAAAYGSLLLLFAIFPAARMQVVPRSVSDLRASRNAREQFLAHGIHETQGRTGVLLFVSLAERYAEVIADTEVNAVVDQSVWDAAVAALVEGAANDDVAEGFLAAIEIVGDVLEAHFPPEEGGRSELDDHLVEL